MLDLSPDGAEMAAALRADRAYSPPRLAALPLDAGAGLHPPEPRRKRFIVRSSTDSAPPVAGWIIDLISADLFPRLLDQATARCPLICRDPAVEVGAQPEHVASCCCNSLRKGNSPLG
jgi:hypothetical protein